MSLERKTSASRICKPQVAMLAALETALASRICKTRDTPSVEARSERGKEGLKAPGQALWVLIFRTFMCTFF